MKKRPASMSPRAAKPRRESKSDSGYVRVHPPIHAPDLRDPPDAGGPALTMTHPDVATTSSATPRGDACSGQGAERRSSRGEGERTKSRSDSHVRLCSDIAPLGRVEELEAHDLLDELAEECAELDARLGRLERASASLELHARPRPTDPRSQLAFDALDRCIAELRRTRVALEAVQRAGAPRSIHHAFACELGDYLRGLCAWIHAVTAAVGQLIAELWAGVPETMKYRARIDAAKNLHFDELEAPVHRALHTTFTATRDAHARELGIAFDVLVRATRALDVRLDTPVAS